MKPTPAGWPRISSGVFYREPAAMIDWLCRTFGFEIRIRVVDDDGRIEHSELTYGDGLIMVGGEKRGLTQRFGMDMSSPLSAGCNTQNLMVYVDDVDLHCSRARTAGAMIVEEPALHEYGEAFWADRVYGATDPEGHLWWFVQRMRNPPR